MKIGRVPEAQRLKANVKGNDIDLGKENGKLCCLCLFLPNIYLFNVCICVSRCVSVWSLKYDDNYIS